MEIVFSTSYLREGRPLILKLVLSGCNSHIKPQKLIPDGFHGIASDTKEIYGGGKCAIK